MGSYMAITKAVSKPSFGKTCKRKRIRREALKITE
jgi:hypothetical protein